jgi:hypothetical protein
MLVKGRTKEKNERSFFESKSRHRKGKAKCWYCGKTGHLKKYCWKRKESEENSTKEANLAVTNSGMIDQVLSVSSNLKYQEEWKLDSGASHHMCSHRNWFFSYQSVDEGVVFMGNGIPCKTVGVGSIRIRMFNGIVRELTDVRYVLELKSNLISLGVLDSCGYKYIGQGGALTLSKGSLVVMKATKVDNLYKLEGSIEVASEVTDVSSCLWKKNQVHKSKKELQVLVKGKSFSDLKSLFLNSCLFYISASYDGGIKGCCVWDPTSQKVIIDRDIVRMEHPKGLIQDHNDKFVCMLENSLYGLLVPRKIYKRFESFIVSQNFSKGRIDYTVYSTFTVLMLFVDDMLDAS